MRIALFTSASCTGWCYTYEANDAIQAHLRNLADEYDSQEKWQERNCDGSVELYDDLPTALASIKQGFPDCDATTADELLAFFLESGDGQGCSTTADEIERMLTTDPLDPDWSV